MTTQRTYRLLGTICYGMGWLTAMYSGILLTSKYYLVGAIFVMVCISFFVLSHRFDRKGGR